MAIAEVQGYKIVPFSLDHIGDLFSLFQLVTEHFPYFSDHNGHALKTETSFANWAFRVWGDAVVGLAPNNLLVSVSYLTRLSQGHMANIHTAFLPAYWKPALTQAMAHEVMAYFFEKWDLVKIQGYVDQENRLSRLFSRRIGMKYDGEIRAFARKDGEWRDYFIYSMLREELNGAGGQVNT